MSNNTATDAKSVKKDVISRRKFMRGTAVAGVAASLTVDKSGTCIGARIGVTGTGPSAYRAIKSETILVGTKLDQDSIEEAGANILESTSVNEDVHASSEYRAHLTKVYAVKALASASSRVK